MQLSFSLRYAGALTRMARPLTLARWVTDDADGAAADLDAAGLLTAPGRRSDQGSQAQVGSDAALRWLLARWLLAGGFLPVASLSSVVECFAHG